MSESSNHSFKVVYSTMLTYGCPSYFTMFFSFLELKRSSNFQLQPVFVDCIGDLFENQVVLFEAILKSGRYVNQVCSGTLLFVFFRIHPLS